jgi:hypothetical protein
VPTQGPGLIVIGKTPDANERGGPDREPVEAACYVRLFLLLALVVSLRRMLVRRFGFLHRLGGLLLRIYMVIAAVLFSRGAMSFRSLLVMFGSLLVCFLGH